jgi:hypothetical protein
MGAGAPGSARIAMDSSGPLNTLLFQQCVTAVAGSGYDFGGRFRFASGGVVPLGALSVQWYLDGSCNDFLDEDAYSSASSNTPDTWQLVSASNVLAPPGIGSALVSTFITTPGAGTGVAWFDDVYFGLNPTPVALQGFVVE